MDASFISNRYIQRKYCSNRNASTKNLIATLDMTLKGQSQLHHKYVIISQKGIEVGHILLSTNRALYIVHLTTLLNLILGDHERSNTRLTIDFTLSWVFTP